MSFSFTSDNILTERASPSVAADQEATSKCLHELCTPLNFNAFLPLNAIKSTRVDLLLPLDSVSWQEILAMASNKNLIAPINRYEFRTHTSDSGDITSQPYDQHQDQTGSSKRRAPLTTGKRPAEGRHKAPLHFNRATECVFRSRGCG